MKVLLMAITLVLVFSCNSNTNNDVESRIKKYMSDTVAKKLDDPSSYEFVSMQIDTVKGIDEYNDLKRLSNNSVLFDSVKREEMKSELSEIESTPGYMDSVFKYFVKVNYRAKNRLGVAILSKINLWYFPQNDVIQPTN